MRFGPIAALAVLASCASTPKKSAEQVLAEQCARNVNADARCVEVLTGSADTREAEAEVAKAEEARERNAFRSRLERLRRDEEARQAQRARTATVARSDDWEEEDRAAWMELLSKGRETGGDVGSGSSVRALTASKGRPVPPPPPPVLKIDAPTSRDPDKPKTAEQGPTPEAYLFGARCLLRADLVLLKQTLAEAKKRNGRGDIAGSLALVIVDAQGVLSRVDETIKKRRLGTAPMCSSTSLRLTVTLLRTLVGPRPKINEAGDSYGRGLGRLVTELDKRADLARLE